MQAITTIGLDIAKSVFQVDGIDAEGNVLMICLGVALRNPQPEMRIWIESLVAAPGGPDAPSA